MDDGYRESTKDLMRLSAILALVVLSLGLAALGTFSLIRAERERTASVETPAPEIQLDPTTLQGVAAVLYDPQTGRVLFEKNAEVQMPLASLAKLMTVYAVLEQTPPDTSVVITAKDLSPSGDWGIQTGDTFTVSDLIKLGLVASSNDAIAAAASTVANIIPRMNDTAASIGLTQTYFLDTTGLDVNAYTAGAYGSARDIALLAAAFLKKYPEYFEYTLNDEVTIAQGDRAIEADSTSLPLHSMTGFIGAKTGTTSLAGGNLVAAVDLDIGHPVIAVVLGSSEESRFDDMHLLISAARAAYNIR